MVGSVASVGNNFHKGHASATQASPINTDAFRGPFTKSQSSNRRMTGGGDEGAMRVGRADVK